MAKYIKASGRELYNKNSFVFHELIRIVGMKYGHTRNSKKAYAVGLEHIHKQLTHRRVSKSEIRRLIQTTNWYFCENKDPNNSRQVYKISLNFYYILEVVAKELLYLLKTNDKSLNEKLFRYMKEKSDCGDCVLMLVNSFYQKLVEITELKSYSKVKDSVHLDKAKLQGKYVYA